MTSQTSICCTSSRTYRALLRAGSGPGWTQAPEFDEVADLIVGVLKATEPVTASTGKPGKAKYTVADGVPERTRARAAELLDRFPLYPGLEDWKML